MLPILLATLLTSTSVLANPILAKRNLGGVRLCTQVNYGGDCWYGIVPLKTCIALNSFKGEVLSFRPDEGTECYLMQGRCDADTEFVSLGTNDPFDGEMSQFDWIANAESFTCVTAINETETENETEEAQTSGETVARRK